MSGDMIAVLGVGVTLLAAILTFGFALLGAHRATQATLNGRMDRVDQRWTAWISASTAWISASTAWTQP